MPAVGKVLIVGGGIAGMTLAFGLKRAGVEVEIVELNAQWTVLGVGISLQAPALRALKMIDLLDRCVEIGFGYSQFKTCDANGNVTATVDMPRLNGPDYPSAMGVMRQALHDLLKRELVRTQVPVRLGITVSSLSSSRDGVDVQFTDGTSGRYDLIVGADGAGSKIRDILFGIERRPEYTGQAVWRATVRRPLEVQGRCSYFGPRNKAGFNPVSNEMMYIYLVQNLPTFVRISDDELPGVMREQLADFGGVIGALRETIVDPNEIVYRPVASQLLPQPCIADAPSSSVMRHTPRRRTWPPAPESPSRIRSFWRSCCNRRSRSQPRWRSSWPGGSNAVAWSSTIPACSANGKRRPTCQAPIPPECSSEPSRRWRNRSEHAIPVRERPSCARLCIRRARWRRTHRKIQARRTECVVDDAADLGGDGLARDHRRGFCCAGLAEAELQARDSKLHGSVAYAERGQRAVCHSPQAVGRSSSGFPVAGGWNSPVPAARE
jgi:2-polyprenyl-6-methoxyphenol hydroxylase-like FAD-dependent oxidoreductase